MSRERIFRPRNTSGTRRKKRTLMGRIPTLRPGRRLGAFGGGRTVCRSPGAGRVPGGQVGQQLEPTRGLTSGCGRGRCGPHRWAAQELRRISLAGKKVRQEAQGARLFGGTVPGGAGPGALKNRGPVEGRCSRAARARRLVGSEPPLGGAQPRFFGAHRQLQGPDEAGRANFSSFPWNGVSKLIRLAHSH